MRLVFLATSAVCIRRIRINCNVCPCVNNRQCKYSIMWYANGLHAVIKIIKYYRIIGTIEMI